MRILIALAATSLLLAGCGRSQGAFSDADRAACADQAGEPAQAEAACNRLLAASAGEKKIQAQVYFNRGLARSRMGRQDDGIADMDESLRLVPGNAAVLGNRGVLHAMKNEFDPAMKDLDAAIALDPKQANALGNRATLLQKLNRHEDAVADYDQAIALDPRMAQGWSGRCWSLGILNRELEQARADCNKAIEVNPSDWNSYNSRGFVEYRMGRFADAIASYDTAIEHDPSVPSSWLVRGLAKRASGDAAGGDQDVAKGESMDPTVADRFRSYGLNVGTAGGSG